MRIKIALALTLGCITVARADPRWVTGLYRNPALGYSIIVPSGLKGMTGDQAGPERGMRVELPSGGTISVFGEPNSFEWKSPSEGIEWTLADEKCDAERRQDISRAHVGSLMGAEGKLWCGNQIEETLLAFRTRGGPIYWLTLRTDLNHEHEDQSIFNDFAASFKLIRWQ